MEEQFGFIFGGSTRSQELAPRERAWGTTLASARRALDASPTPFVVPNASPDLPLDWIVPFPKVVCIGETTYAVDADGKVS